MHCCITSGSILGTRYSTKCRILRNIFYVYWSIIRCYHHGTCWHRRYGMYNFGYCFNQNTVLHRCLTHNSHDSCFTVFVAIRYWIFSPHLSLLLHCYKSYDFPCASAHPWWVWVNRRCEPNKNFLIFTVQDVYLMFSYSQLCANICRCLFYHFCMTVFIYIYMYILYDLSIFYLQNVLLRCILLCLTEPRARTVLYWMLFSLYKYIWNKKNNKKNW